MNASEIRATRDALDLSPTEFAYRLGVSTDAVRKWENGTAKPGGPATILLRQLQEQAKQSTNGTNGHARAGRKAVGAK